jgi:hypothetical protein
MKKLLAIFILFAGLGSCAIQAQAHEGFRHNRGGYYNAGNWIGPALIGGVIGYELSRPRYYEQPVIIQQPPVYAPPVYIQQPQPVIQAPPYGYHWQEMVDPQTGVRKIVAVPN